MADVVVAGREERSVNPLIWKACAGNSVRIPAAGSLVYYFPQGHAEQASAAPDFSPVVGSFSGRSYFLCRLSRLQFLANHDSDEVYTKMSLVPCALMSAALSSDYSSVEDAAGEEEDGGVFSFAKVLTPSDANNGGGFSVPRFCADSIFPPLNYSDDPPLQMLRFRDVHGAAWDFRHIYRGTPRRHLLTTGWSKFVNSKKLVAGDSVVFIKNRSGELFVGVRRTPRSGGPLSLLHSAQRQMTSQLALRGAKPRRKFSLAGAEGFSRNCRGRITPEAVVEAARLAAQERPFEVVYYPRAGSPDFVVRKDVVDTSLQVLWSSGTRVKMVEVADNPSRMTWFQGTVSRIVRHPPPFSHSPWRTLEVTWDEPDVFQKVKRVSPWQLELLSASPQILTPYPMIKKPRTTQNQELRVHGAEQNTYFLMSEFPDTVVQSISPSVFNQNIFPAGMQGARHDPMCVFNLSKFLPNNTHQMYSEKLNVNNILPKATHVSTELNIGCVSQSESSSPPSQNSICYHPSEFLGSSAVNRPSEVINGSFQLFGKIIQVEQPVVANVKKQCNNNIVSVRPYNVSLSCPPRNFHDEHDGPPQRVRAVKT